MWNPFKESINRGFTLFDNHVSYKKALLWFQDRVSWSIYVVTLIFFPSCMCQGRTLDQTISKTSGKQSQSVAVQSILPDHPFWNEGVVLCCQPVQMEAFHVAEESEGGDHGKKGHSGPFHFEARNHDGGEADSVQSDLEGAQPGG
jgi:hypothetical protein